MSPQPIDMMTLVKLFHEGTTEKSAHISAKLGAFRAVLEVFFA